MNKIFPLLLKHRKITIAIILLITILLGLQIGKLKINSDIFSSLPKDDPAAVLYRAIGEKYQGSSIGIIILESKNLYSYKTLADVAKITEIVQNTDGVQSVTSITSIINIKSDEAGIEIGNLVDPYNIPQTSDEIKKLKEVIESNQMYHGAIVSKDGKSTIIMFTIDSGVNQEKVGIEIKDKIGASNFDQTIHYGGLPMMMQELSSIIFTDMLWLIPLVVLILLLILFLSFKSFKAAILPLITVGIATIWTLGIMGLFGYEISMIGGMIPVILFAVGSAYAIHVVNHISENIQENYIEGIITSLKYLILPVFLSSLTTVFGFLSFIFGSYLTMIKEFGAFCALGTFFSFLLAILFIPTIVSFFPITQKKVIKKETFLSKFILKPLSNVITRHPKYILLFWSVIVTLGVIGTFQIDRSTNLATFFKKESQTRISEITLQEKFGGSAPVYIIFKGDIQDPKVLLKMKEVSNFLKKNRYISNTTSVADLIEQMNNGMGEGLQIPNDRAKIEQLWFLLEGQEIMNQLVSENLDEAIIQSRFASSSTKETQKFIHEVEAYIGVNKIENLDIQLSGMPSVYANMDKSLLNSQLSSLAIAIVLVLVLVSISLKSIKLGLLGIIPILVTVTAIFGFMGFSSIALDVATVSVASIVLGIGIDYSIHTITSFNFFMQQTHNLQDAIQKTILLTGKSILINAVSVSVGFSILVFAHLVPMQYMGLLVAISMIFSAAGALTLLPVMLIIYNRIKIKHLKIKTNGKHN